MTEQSFRTNPLFIDGLPFNIEKTARVSYLLGKSYYKDIVKSRLELVEYTILSYIISTPGLSQSDLSKLLFKGKAHIGKILNDMEDKGYIKRIASSENNILKKITKITPKGKPLSHKTHEVFKNLGEKVLEDFSKEEIETFNNLLNKYRTKILDNFEIEF